MEKFKFLYQRHCLSRGLLTQILVLVLVRRRTFSFISLSFIFCLFPFLARQIKIFILTQLFNTPYCMRFYFVNVSKIY